MYLDPQGDVILDMDVEARRGLAPAVVDAQVERWIEVVREAEAFIGWKR
jgi:regulator of RNase E activity RraB